MELLEPPVIDLILILGLLFAVAVIFGSIAKVLHMPRVVGYLLGGLALAIVFRYLLPDLLPSRSPAEGLARILAGLGPLKEIALGFIMFDIGSRFAFSTLRRTLQKMAPISVAEMGATLFLVTVAIWITSGSWQVGILLGTMAIATAPVTTLMVLRQYESEGPLTEHIYTLLAFNNAVSILLFGLAFLVVELQAGQAAAHRVITDLPWDVLGSLGIGLVGGIMVSYFYERVAPRVRSAMLMAVLICALGMSRTLGVPYMLSLLVLGAVMANTTEYHREMIGVLEAVAGPLYVLFFVTAGADLHLDALSAIGLVGIVYVVARTTGKLLGAWLGGRAASAPGPVRRMVGVGLLSQAGAAIGLGMLAASRDPVLGAQLLSVILASVVIFEIAGPILLKTVLVRAGEVKVIHFLEHSPQPGYLSSLRTLLRRLAESVGVRRSPNIASLLVRDVMATNVRSINQAATFREVIDFVEHSRHNLFPVVDGSGRYLGYIPYNVIQGLMVDPTLKRLLIARDFMISDKAPLTADDPLHVAVARFEELNLDALPVLDPGKEKLLVGLLERREVLRLLRRRISDDEETGEAGLNGQR